MREHLYKAKCVNWKELPKENWWVQGYLMNENYINIPLNNEDVWGRYDEQIEVDPETVCEYIGETDKNGRWIFENDITKLVLPGGEVRYFKVSFKKVVRKVLCHPDFYDDIAKVKLNAVCFEWNGYELFPCVDDNGASDVSKMEVVGNFFDNPDFLKEETT